MSQSGGIEQYKQGDMDELVADGVEPSVAYDLAKGRRVEQAPLQAVFTRLAD